MHGERDGHGVQDLLRRRSLEPVPRLLLGSPRRFSTCPLLARPAPARRCPDVTSAAPRVRISSCTPSDGALVTGPGTPMTTRFTRLAQFAVLRAPLRTAASTTTVPSEIAAIRRLRDRKRSFVGAQPGGASETTRPPEAAMYSSRSRWRRRVGTVGAAGEHGNRRSVGRRAHHGDAAWSMPKAAPETTVKPCSATCGRDLAGHRRAVRRRRPRPHHRDRASSELVETDRAPDPQAERSTTALVHGPTRGRGRPAGSATRRRPGTRTGCPAWRRAPARSHRRVRRVWWRPRWRARCRRARAPAGRAPPPLRARRPGMPAAGRRARSAVQARPAPAARRRTPLMGRPPGR